MQKYHTILRSNNFILDLDEFNGYIGESQNIDEDITVTETTFVADLNTTDGISNTNLLNNIQNGLKILHFL